MTYDVTQRVDIRYDVTQRVTVSPTPTLANCLEEYQKSHQISSRNEAIAQAIVVLREKELAEVYADYARSGEFVDLETGESLEESGGRWQQG